jgi:hypothetical protein
MQINAWAGDGAVASDVDSSLLGWAFRSHAAPAAKYLWPEVPVDLADWRDPAVGWGLILPDDDELDDETRATGADAPAPIRRLLAAREGAPVLRYRPQTRFTHLRRYDLGARPQDISLSGSERGIARGSLPRYLLIYGTPEQVPWGMQYLLNQSAAVGRLTLSGAGLEHYVEALLSDWQDAGSHAGRTAIWSVDHDPADITHLMRQVIADPIQAEMERDVTTLGPGTVRLGGDGAAATRDGLVDVLADHRPGLVVTTSHGMTGPLDDPVATRTNLGLLVDEDHELLHPSRLLAAWEPDGAVWYAHACCSAGSDAATSFEGILPAGSPVDRVLRGVAAIGAHVAPLPEALLGAPKPLRAFIGHVEPTFDWTLRQRETGQPLTASICEALCRRLYEPSPVGHALRECYAHVGELLGQRDQAYRAFDRGQDTRETALASQLAALDRQSMVILGDPTVALAVPRRRT